MNSMKKALLVVVVAGTVPGTMLVGCGGESAREAAAEATAEKAIESAIGKDANVEIDRGSVKVEGEGFKAEMGETTEWPQDLPPGVPRFSQGKVERVHKSEGDGQRSWNVFLTDVEDGSVDRYAAALKRDGWSVQNVAMGGRGGMISGEKEGLGLNLAYTAEEKRATLSVFVQNP